VLTIGQSILNKTCKSDIGALCLKYGGGGHHVVGTCQVPNEDADRVIKEVIEALREN
jgi:nanoRNase/pAp phosphatase (c-di-AMP/oligoRNAs hydrolase)